MLSLFKENRNSNQDIRISLTEKSDFRKETVVEVETESEREIEKEKEKVEVKTEEKKDSEKFEKEKTVEIEEASDAEIEKLKLGEEEKETEIKTEKESELLSVQTSREVMLGKMEKELIEEHNTELDEAIKQSKAIIVHNQSLIESLERMKNINERRLASLKVKGTPYTPASEKPKRVKHTAGKHRAYGRKPPLHPSSKCPESSTETAPAQNLRSSKRLRTEPKSL
ncbi:hypothetical protein JCGZ_05983 [Jatropha curcas]|uniref:Uncharacterized protein n=1 Tax=Jatropha curcas TaxID=180498 RepID=A0A067L0C2_JATCU|nr:hypothetical protein JCGZ_05983 [Jatropha curcas]